MLKLSAFYVDLRLEPVRSILDGEVWAHFWLFSICDQCHGNQEAQALFESPGK